MIPISFFDQGWAERIFEQVQEKETKIVVADDCPVCILMSPEKYIRLMDDLEDARLAAIAAERLEHLDMSKLISHEEILRECGLTEENIKDVDPCSEEKEIAAFMTGVCAKEIIPVSVFDAENAEAVFDEVLRSGMKVVIKDDQAICILLSPENYINLADELDELKLFAIASERIAHMNPNTLISQEEFDKMFGFTDEDDDDNDVDIEFD